MDVLASFLKKWWIALILGILAIGLGILFIASPGSATSIGSTLFVILFMLVGVVEGLLAIANRKNVPAWGWNLFLAILIVVFGICMLSIPYLKELTILNLFAIALVLESIYAISNALQYKNQGGAGWGWLLAFGILSAIVSIMLFTNPLLNLLVYELIIAINCFVFGITMISTAILMSKASGVIKRSK